MSNNTNSPAWMKNLWFADKVLSVGAISYGVYLYIQMGTFLTDDWFNNPALWVFGGVLSLIIGLIDIPKLMMKRMKSKMVVRR